MHVLLEGVVPHEITYVLHSFIYVNAYFTLEWLNTAIKGFQYSYLHSSAKPEEIDKNHLQGPGTIKQTAAAMLTLMFILPVLIAHKVPEDDAHWKNTLRLLQIVIFSTSTYCSKETVLFLRTMIAEYLHNFKTLYPRASFTPKMHYMIHLPTQMFKFGPLRHHWCMRFEGKNGYFSNKRYKNFKNLPLSLANRHQLYMAYMQTGNEGNPSKLYLNAGDIVGKGRELNLQDVYPDLCGQFQNTVGYETDMVTIKGMEYRPGCAIVLDYDDDDQPRFAILHHIIIINDVKYFILQRVETEFGLHILSYVVTYLQHKVIIPYKTLKFKWPLSVYTYKGKRVVMNANSHTYAFPF